MKYDDLIGDYVAGPGVLRRSVAGMTRDQLLARPGPQKVAKLSLRGMASSTPPLAKATSVGGSSCECEDFPGGPRSLGLGVHPYFQKPLCIPERQLGQLNMNVRLSLSELSR